MCPFQWLCVIHEFGFNELESIVWYICSSSKAYQKKKSCLSHSLAPSSPCVLPVVHYPPGCAGAVVRWSASLRDHSGCSIVCGSLCSEVKKAVVPVWQSQGVGGQKMFFCRRDPLKTRMFLEERYFCCIFQALHLRSLKSVEFCDNLESKPSETAADHTMHFVYSSDLRKLTKSCVLYSGHKDLWHFSVGHKNYPSSPTLFKL